MLEFFFDLCFLLRFLVCVASGVEVLLDDWLFGVLLLNLLVVFVLLLLLFVEHSHSHSGVGLDEGAAEGEPSLSFFGGTSLGSQVP